ALGRGILETAEPSPQGIAPRPERARRFPFDAPGWMLNRASVRAFNAAYWRRVPAGGEERLLPYRKFLYPLDAIHGWNRMYGRAGFRQLQCVVPQAGGAAALRRLLEAVSASGDASFLAVLKSMGRAGRGLLSFAMPGYTLALDVPARPGSAALFAALERITLEAGGRIYLAKDSTLSAAGFATMYPDAGRFQEIRARVDPQHRLSSDMSRRLGLG
ncbi:MAG: FAD-binding oxidoreductase, partial [Acetobacteraceae bacterium]|nr:FAD-binding oxidoreductase [Acetobacteraceae bacterium]